MEHEAKRAFEGVVLTTWMIVKKTSNPRIKQIAKKMIQCERLICGVEVWRAKEPPSPERVGLSANLFFVSIWVVRGPSRHRGEQLIRGRKEVVDTK